MFVSDSHNMHGADASLSKLSYVHKKWRENWNRNKVWRAKRFSVCSTYVKFRVGILQCAGNWYSSTKILRLWQFHVAGVGKERSANQFWNEEYMQDLLKSRLIIDGGVGQSAFGFPHLTATTENANKIVLKVTLMELLEHCVTKLKYLLFNLFEKFQTGAEHNIETVYRFVNSRTSRGPGAS